MKQLQNYYSDFFPDYFSLAEKPPDEFCLSPDATTESISIDLLQKKCEGDAHPSIYRDGNKDPIA